MGRFRVCVSGEPLFFETDRLGEAMDLRRFLKQRGRSATVLDTLTAEMVPEPAQSSAASGSTARLGPAPVAPQKQQIPGAEPPHAGTASA